MGDLSIEQPSIQRITQWAQEEKLAQPKIQRGRIISTLLFQENNYQPTRQSIDSSHESRLLLSKCSYVLLE